MYTFDLKRNSLSLLYPYRCKTCVWLVRWKLVHSIEICLHLFIPNHSKNDECANKNKRTVSDVRISLPINSFSRWKQHSNDVVMTILNVLICNEMTTKSHNWHRLVLLQIRNCSSKPFSYNSYMLFSHILTISQPTWCSLKVTK